MLFDIFLVYRALSRFPDDECSWDLISGNLRVWDPYNTSIQNLVMFEENRFNLRWSYLQPFEFYQLL